MFTLKNLIKFIQNLLTVLKVILHERSYLYASDLLQTLIDWITTIGNWVVFGTKTAFFFNKII